MIQPFFSNLLLFKVTIEPFLLPTKTTYTHRGVVIWAGIVFDELEDCSMFEKDPLPYLAAGKRGVRTVNWIRGSPAGRYGISSRMSELLYKVNDIDVGDLDDFLRVVRNIKHRGSAKLHFLSFKMKVHVVTLVVDLKYFPTTLSRVEQNSKTWSVEILSDD